MNNNNNNDHHPNNNDHNNDNENPKSILPCNGIFKGIFVSVFRVNKFVFIDPTTQAYHVWDFVIRQIHRLKQYPKDAQTIISYILQTFNDESFFFFFSTA